MQENEPNLLATKLAIIFINDSILEIEDDFIFLNSTIVYNHIRYMPTKKNFATPYEKLSHVIHTRGNVCNSDNVMKRDGLFFRKNAQTHEALQIAIEGLF